MRKTLTIGIPTYNRCDAVVQRLNEIFRRPLPDRVSVLVIDNCSDDGTYEKVLQSTRNYVGLRVMRNAQNLGYAGNLFRLIEETESDYLMIDSDEDELLVQELPEYIDFLETNVPCFVSPQSSAIDRINRGFGKRGDIKPEQFREASNYISGITFEVPSVRIAVERVSQKLNTNAAVFVYPQVLLVAEVLAESKCLWYPKVLTVKRQQLSSHIQNLDGGSYSRLVARLQQTTGFIEYLSERTMAERAKTGSNVFQRMLAVTEQWTFKHMRSGLASEHPILLSGFDESAKNFYGGCGEVCRLLNRILRVFRQPSLFVPWIKRKFSLKQ